MREVKVDQFFNHLFPGDVHRGFPCFTSCGIKIEDYLPEDKLKKLENIIMDYKRKENFEINEFIKKIEINNKEFIDEIITILLEAYFSNENVINIIRPGYLTLFPNNRNIGDINYELLEGVIGISPNN